jgi:Photosynthetic reaction centre cytochrome C subunit
MRISRFVLAAVMPVAVVFLSLPAGRSLVFAAPQAAPPSPPHQRPAPTNLKVLPRNLSGDQVHEIMEKWQGELGTRCKSCHSIDPKKTGPDGKPGFNYADDSKEEKQTARKMYQMVQEINANTISKVNGSGMEVTCGTCHRGHFGPEAFEAPPVEHK